jgi:NADPH:quinone reductase-like Zn-dependent oxidoreductase
MRGLHADGAAPRSSLLKTAKQYVFRSPGRRAFHPKIAKTFPLAQSVEAYQYLESNQQVGKVVITV